MITTAAAGGGPQRDGADRAAIESWCFRIRFRMGLTVQLMVDEPEWGPDTPGRDPGGDTEGQPGGATDPGGRTSGPDRQRLPRPADGLVSGVGLAVGDHEGVWPARHRG